jgi:putative ABC transport system ATP-binding protein
MLQLKNICKLYVMGEAAVNALRGLNLEIKPGEFIAIMGPSGSGKSTLMHLLGALDQPSEGSLQFGLEDISQWDEDRLAELRGKKMGFVFQSFQLVPALTALENVELPMIFQNTAKAKRRERAQNLLERVGLAERMHHTPAQLSGGEQQRVAVARAFAHRPKLLFADEPTGNLDAANGQNVVALLGELNREQGTTLVLVTHDPELAGRAHRVIRLRDGALVEDAVLAGARA